MLLVVMFFLVGTVQAELHTTPKKLALAPSRVNQLFLSIGEDDLAEFQQFLVDELADNESIQLVDPELSRAWMLESGLSEDEGCLSLDCMNSLGTHLGVDYVLSVALSGEKRSSVVQFEVRLLSVAEQRVVDREVRAGKNPHKLPSKEAAETIELMLERQLNPKGWITVNTIPPASAILLNGRPVGFAPLTLERASGLADTLMAVRQGFTNSSQIVKLDPVETRTITLELDRETVHIQRQYPPVHLFAIAGLPLDQASSNLDSRLSWGDGESYGFRADAGSIWRIGLGFMLYDGIIDDIDQGVMTAAGVIGNPEVIATAVHSNLFYYPGSEVFSPYLGLGVAAVQRHITQRYADFSEERKTDFEASWMFMFGLEAKLYGPFRAQVELMHARALIESDAWSFSTDTPEERALWEGSFEDFSSFSVIRFAVGFTF
jgi:PEGA domain